MALNSKPALLKVEDVHASYGAIRALRGVSLDVEEGEIVTLIGANGGGKTTLLSIVTGLLKPDQGAVHFKGKPIHSLRADAIVRRGIAMVPEGRGIFASLTVHENLLMGAYHRSDGETIKRDLCNVVERFPILGERRKQVAGTLSGGQQQMLAIGRALMANPKLIIFDEPSLGLAPLVVAEVMLIVRQLREGGMTVLLAEQNARIALRCADRGYVLETGTVRLAGDSSSLLANDLVKEAYLGGAS